jgi:Effector-associated domain 11
LPQISTNFNKKQTFNRMNITEEVKELIGNGKTEEALEWLQSILKEHDKDLLNQTYLLQTQYKDVQNRVRLGLQDASTELNRINFTLLTICDDVEKVVNASDIKPKRSLNSPNSDKSSLAIWVFAAIVLIAFALIFVVFKYSQNDNGKKDRPTQTEQTKEDKK